MSVQFLSDEYVESAQESLAGHGGFVSAIAGKELALQFHVTDLPDGSEIDYYISIADDAADVGLGELEANDIKVTNTYETAVGISKGELNTQMAFMTGKLKVSGDMAKLMLNQAVLTELTNAMATIETDY